MFKAWPFLVQILLVVIGVSLLATLGILLGLGQTFNLLQIKAFISHHILLK